MCKFFMLVGIAGCGKSTWAQENLGHYNMFDEIYSSDVYREKLFNDVNDQEHNAAVFKAMHTDIIEALKAGKSVCYDATNLTRKSRRNILTAIELNKIECEKIAVLFEIEESIVRRQNANRDRNVPEVILNQMFRRFEIPFYGEGFDTINVVFRKENGGALYQSVVETMNGFDQDNPHHSLDLFHHCKSCYDYLSRIEEIQDNKELLVASLIHDVGKLYTKVYDEGKGYSHFIGHENYGAYQSLFFNYSPMVVDREKIAFYINYHMEPYRLANAKDSTMARYKELFGDEWENLVLLHEADDKAH